MIHDILLTCLHITKKRLSIEEFMISEAASHFIHPCEKKILEEIVNILNSMRDLVVFVKVYGGRRMASKEDPEKDTCETLRYGLYLNSFANGIEQVLIEYYDEIIELEEYIMKTPTHSLVFIYDRLQEQVPIANFLRKLVRGIKLRKLHGCALLYYLFQHTQQGDQRLDRVITMVMRPVTMIFISQLTSWVIYGIIDDDYGEFFLQCTSDQVDASTLGSERNTSLADSCSTEEDIWQYEINMEQLPQFLSSTWAEKVLFIGQTVLLFKLDSQRKVSDFEWAKTFITSQSQSFDLWEKNEMFYLKKLQDLNMDDSSYVYRYESVINEIKKYVTTRLSKIAIDDIDLDCQMRVIKDFYLLGRGELYLEFLRQVHHVKLKLSDVNDSINYVKIFEVAAVMVGAADELENFEVSMVKKITHNESDCPNEFSWMQNFHLKYKYKWPLNLLFSPKAIERYNIVLRFLIMIKKLQYELHLIWRDHHWSSKKDATTNIKAMQLRNQFMFFIDNLQYYIQVDVLESQYSVLLNVINGNADFEEIQRAHSVFQANVLSQCFLMSEENGAKMNNTQSSYQIQNPVFVAINDIFRLSGEFINLFESNLEYEKFMDNIVKIEERFEIMMSHLIKLMVDIKSCTNTPLLQLLLRLDFNYWFTARNSTNGVHSESDC